MKKVAAKPKRLPRPRVTRWTREVVSERALDLYACERVAEHAHARAIEKCNQFKEKVGVERVDHNDPSFRRYTARTWATYVEARHQANLAKRRLTTACRNHLCTPVRADKVLARMLKKSKPVAPKPVPQADDWLVTPF
ncbi:hypothetical protein [Paraburkholderia rhynchosiae]|uniref:Uncharacterized protein n=1 Tax=Paraburkholderia rhynchosiae TaxID=487049 RepID=A0A2N7WUB7_9BURK|nr:hypothetical protein [Paraburkholderia rhynchosiae]PMS32855.1 hypothetical protein C0Z16_04720 [Paraburkholderia rhynchosiae]CAB3645678.1 hypothetical protein LMG27174_00834 [Paraburkholderia rhynchosiae]